MARIGEVVREIEVVGLSCCPLGTHSKKTMCRRAFFIFARLGRRVAEAFGKLRPERLRGARPSNSTPTWYAFHRKEK